MRRHFEGGLLRRCLARWHVQCEELHGVTQDRLQYAAAFAFATSTGAASDVAGLHSLQRLLVAEPGVSQVCQM